MRTFNTAWYIWSIRIDRTNNIKLINIYVDHLMCSSWLTLHAWLNEVISNDIICEKCIPTIFHYPCCSARAAPNHYSLALKSIPNCSQRINEQYKISVVLLHNTNIEKRTVVWLLQYRAFCIGGPSVAHRWRYSQHMQLSKEKKKTQPAQGLQRETHTTNIRTVLYNVLER